MQKRVVGNINELNEASRKTASEESANTAGTNRGGCKANKTSFGRFKKFAVIIMLLIVSVFCAIGSADWIISQQEQLPGGSGSTFVYDKKTLQNYIALKGSDETEAAAKVAEAEEYASLQTETDSDDSAAADKLAVKKAAVSKKTAVSAYANGLESAIYGKSAIYNGKPIVAIKKTAGIDNAAAELPDEVLNGSLLTKYKPLTDGSVTEDSLDETYFAEGATSGLPKDAGTYAILIKIKGLETYGYAVKIFTILPCPVTVEWSGVDFANGFTYDGTAHSVTATAKIASSDNGNAAGSAVNANLSVSITKNGASANEIKNAGNYLLTAASGNDNYVIYDTEATKTANFTVKKAPLTVTVNGKTITYGDNLPEFTLSYSGFVNGETVSVLGGKEICTHEYEQFSNVGTYTVTASGLTSENYEITYEQGTLTVKKYGLELSWSPLTFVYDKNSHVPTAAITNRLPSGAADYGLNVSVTTGEAINAGSYTAKASVPDDGNYYISSGETTNFTVTAKKATVTVNLSKTELVFGSEAPTATINYSGVISGDSLGTPEFDYGGYKKGSDIGTYTVTVKGLANGNYDIKTTPASFTVKPYGLNVTWSDLTFTYDKTAHKPTATVSNPIDGLTAPVIAVTTYSETGVAAEAINAGSYTAKASVADTNYYIASGETASFTINKKSVTIIVGKSVTYGDTATFSENDLTITGLIGNDTLGGNPTFASEYTAGSPVTEEGYAITVTFSETALNPNYSLDSLVITGTLTVNKKALTIKVKDCSVNYGGDPDFELEYTGFVNGETSAVLSGKPVFGCDYEKGTSPAGKTYTVTVSGLYSKNYKITYLSGTLTVNKKSVTITIEDKKITYGDEAPTSYSYTIKDTLTGGNISTDEFTAINSKIEFACPYQKGYPAGDYKITATYNNDNYTLNVTPGTLTVKQKELTLVANDNTIIYGDAPSAKGYYFEGFVCGDTQATANIAADVTFSYDYKQNGDIYDTDGNKIDYAITPIINNFTSTNYTYSSVRNGKLTVNKLAVSLNVIKSNYASGGLTFDKSLFNGAFTSNNSQVDLSKAYEAVISNESKPITAKNFTGTADTSKAENGYFSYSFGTAIKVGSTYIIENITLAEKCNYRLTSSTTYLKYQTAKIGDNFYTIEDALAKSGDITIIGDSTDSASYVITAFSKLGLDSSKDSAFSDYKSNYAYTLNGKLIVSFDGQNSTEYSHNKSAYSKGFVKSAFIIPSGVNLTLAASSNLIIGAAVAFNQDVSTTVAMNRGVIMNNGQITAQNGSNISSYGYVKGTGNIIMQNGSKAVDALAIYDWPGGIAASSMYKNVFPSNAYTMHNISCKTVIYAGAIYSAKVYVYMSKFGIEKEVDVEQIIIGTQSEKEKGMFNLTNNSDKGKTDTYIIKSVTTYNGEINSSITSTNQRIKEGSDQYLNHRDKIEIYGNYSDDSLKITVEALGVKATLENNTSKTLPVGFMDVYVCRGTMNLTKSDYLILPGACIKVENGGTLNLGSNVDIVAMPYSSMPTGGRGYFNYYTSSTDGSGKQDGKLIVNGTLTGNDYNLGGKILTESANSTLTVVNASGSYVTMISTASPYYKSGTISAVGNIITDRSNYGEANFSAGEYTSYKFGDKYYWAKSSSLKTVTLLSDGKQYGKPVTEIIGTNITLPTGLSKEHYAFGGWSDGSTVYNGSFTVPGSDVTLNAVWTPITYTINYEFWYNDQKLSDELTANIVNTNPATFTVAKNIIFERASLKGYTFDKWYIDSEFGTSVSQTSDALKHIENGSVTITLYGRFIEPAYTITYHVNNDEISAEALKTFVNNLQFEYSSPDTYISYLENGTAFSPVKIDINYNDTTKSKYFLGWYTDENCETPFSALSDTKKVNLYAKWGLKAQVVVTGIDNAETSLGYGVAGSEFSFSTSTLTDTANTYKLIGTSGAPTCNKATATVTTNNSNLNDISVSVKVDSLTAIAATGTNAAPQIKVTADIRKILTVNITMSRAAHYRSGLYTGNFEINQIIINNNSYYSFDKSNWSISNNVNIKNASTGIQTFYVLQQSATLTIDIKDLTLGIKIDSKTFQISNPQQSSGCTYTSSHSGSTSTFVFTITDNATIKWSGTQT
ncbi:MAG: hypothetical protein HP008_02110 [Clostridia bacterium]|nr:hypothetical protein [Clostridia bacterium]